MFIYDEGNAKGFNGKLGMLDPNACYLKHYENYKFLYLMEQRSKEFLDRAQATKEIQIANNKMAFWEKKPGFDRKLVNERRKEIDALWNTK